MDSGGCNQNDAESDWVIINKRDGKSIHLPRSMVFVGREDCDIIIHSASIDKRHAVIYFNANDNLFYIKDLNSSYGTFINDTKIQELSYVKINHMDKVRFGFAAENFLICRIPSPTELQRSSQSSPSKSNTVHTNADSPSHEKNAVVPQTFPIQKEQLKVLGVRCKDVDVSSAEESKTSNSSISTVDSLEENVLKPIHKINGNALSPVKEQSASFPKEHKLLKSNPKSEIKQKISEDMSVKSPMKTAAPAMAFTIAFDDGKKTFEINDSIRKFAPPKPDTIEKPKPPKLRQPKSSEEKKQINKSKKQVKNVAKPEGHLSDSASYLIQRMLSSEPLSPNVEESGLRKSSNSTNSDKFGTERLQSPTGSSKKMLRSPPGGEKDSGVCDDDKSETGTYTVDVETTDPSVDEARKRIDEVFGVKLLPAKSSKANDSSNSNGFYLNLSNQGDIGVRDEKLESEELSDAETFNRSKRRLPPVPPKSNNEFTKRASLKGNGVDIDVQDKDSLENSSWKNNFNEKSNSSNFKSTNYVKKLLKNKTHYGKYSSSSDVETGRYESGSANSDDSESTELNSWDSDKCKSDTNANSPQMRFNRAFALRRARLGIETPGVVLKSRVPKAKTEPQKQRTQNRSSIPSPYLNRNDGGRFSLRTTKSTGENKKPPMSSSGNRSSSSREDLRKCVNQRKSSDPVHVRSQDKLNRSSLSDVENDYSPHSSPRHYSSVQRSSSFAEKQKVDSRNSSNVDHLKKMSAFQISKRIFSTNPHQIAKVDSSMRLNRPQKDSMTTSLIEKKQNYFSESDPFNKRRQSKELSALDYLVISAIHQLSSKIRNTLGNILEKSRLKYPKESETRLMIEEMLPQFTFNDVRLSETGDNTTSKDLSNILKNLKKIEQSLAVISLVADPGESVASSTNGQLSQSKSTNFRSNYFSVDL